MDFEVYILLGSNLGNKKEQLLKATEAIASKAGNILHTSSYYQTAAWGNTRQDDFLNQVICIKTRQSAQQLLETLLQIELQMGRKRNEKWESRVIDLDILFYGNAIVQESNLQIPHPFIPQRRFTLVPMVELDPAFMHPVLHKTMQALLDECPDKLPVEKTS